MARGAAAGRLISPGGAVADRPTAPPPRNHRMNAHLTSLLVHRLLIALLTLLIVSFTVFCATAILPGDVAQMLLGQAATPEAVAGLRQAMKLDQPALLRFLGWLGGLLTGDFGTSYVNGLPVSRLIGGRLGNSLQLAAATALFSVPVALTLGITAAMLRGSVYDRAVTVATITVISVPEFMVATAGVLVFAVWLQWLPALSFSRDVQTLGELLRVYAMPVWTRLDKTKPVPERVTTHD